MISERERPDPKDWVGFTDHKTLEPYKVQYSNVVYTGHIAGMIKALEVKINSLEGEITELKAKKVKNA